jgi:hypothetical protein
MRPQFVFGLLWFISGGVVSFSGAAEQHMMESRVPRDKLAEAKALVSPFQDSPEILAKGKALYEGKGTCVNCHGQSGAGDGPRLCIIESCPEEFSSPWILAPSYGGGNLLGNQVWVARYFHDWLRRGSDRRRDLGAHSVRATLRRRAWPKERNGAPPRERGDGARRRWMLYRSRL